VAPYVIEAVVVPSTGSGSSLRLAVLRRGAPEIEERTLEQPDWDTTALAVSDDGQRVLLSGRSSVSLVESASGRLLGRLPLSDVRAADFLSGGSVRLYLKDTDSSGRVAFVVLDWSPKDDARTERARLPGDSRLWLMARRGDLAVVSMGRRGRALVDAGRGATRTLDPATSDSPGAALVLSSGNVAVDFGDEVRIVTREGETVVRLPVGPGRHVYELSETAPGELAVGLWRLSPDERRTVFFDPATGAMRHEEYGLLPAGPWLGGIAPRPEPGSFASRLFIDTGRALIALDPDGRRRTVVPSR